MRDDIRHVSPETEVRLWPHDPVDPWDFEEVYGLLHDFARAYPFDTDREDYLIHITTGTHVAQICLFLLTESRHFRDLNAAVTRLATLAGGGRITVEQVDAEIAHLRTEWAPVSTAGSAGLVERVLSAEQLAKLDRFDRVQLEDVLGICRTAGSLSAAGRVLFSQSRQHKRIANDADRLRKYLARLGLDWGDLKERLRGEKTH